MLCKPSPFIVAVFVSLSWSACFSAQQAFIPARAAVSVLYAKSSAAGTLPGQCLHPANHPGNRRAGR